MLDPNQTTKTFLKNLNKRKRCPFCGAVNVTVEAVTHKKHKNRLCHTCQTRYNENG